MIIHYVAFMLKAVAYDLKRTSNFYQTAWVVKLPIGFIRERLFKAGPTWMCYCNIINVNNTRMNYERMHELVS